MIQALRLRAQRLVVIAWLERDQQQGGIVNQSVLTCTYKYATDGSHFKELGRAVEEITWGEGAYAHVWGRRETEVVRVELRRNTRRQVDHRSVAIPTVGCGFYNVTISPATRSSNAIFPLDNIQQFGRAIALRTYSDTDRSELKLVGWRGWNADQGQGAVPLVCQSSTATSRYQLRLFIDRWKPSLDNEVWPPTSS